jgi:hypothetical protein
MFREAGYVHTLPPKARLIFTLLMSSAALLFAVLIVGYDPIAFDNRKGAPRGSFDGFFRSSHSFDLFTLFVISDDPVTV